MFEVYFERSLLIWETQCCTVATIDTVLAANGWTYDHCIKCNKNAHTCGCGEKNPGVDPRFRVEVMVSDNGDSAKFVLWNNECAQLLKKTAVDLRNEMIAVGELDPITIPATVDNPEGKTLAFKIKVCLIVQQSESATADYDPEQLCDLTPSKTPNKSLR